MNVTYDFASKFHDSTYVEPVLTDGEWRLSWLTNNDCWRLDNYHTGMMITFDSIIISAQTTQLKTDDTIVASFISTNYPDEHTPFPAELEQWILEHEHTGTIPKNATPTP